MGAVSVLRCCGRMNLVLAANALGYATNWISNWYLSDEKGRALLGLAPHERVTGSVHIGSCPQKVPERPRPDNQGHPLRIFGSLERLICSINTRMVTACRMTR